MKRPTSISIIAVLMMSSLLSIPMEIITTHVRTFPLMGVVIEGLSARLISVLYSIISVVIGYGLWRMKAWAWKLGAALSVFTIVNVCVCSFVPGVYERIIQLKSGEMSTRALAITQQLQIYAGWWLPVSINALICYFLVSRRRFFQKV